MKRERRQVEGTAADRSQQIAAETVEGVAQQIVEEGGRQHSKSKSVKRRMYEIEDGR